jgi:hypothetical protein
VSEPGRDVTVIGRASWLAVGWLAVACGVAGIVLPLVPTTPFLLVAAYAFARSSPRLHAWLLAHPQLGPPIESWQAHGAISRSAKTTAIVVMGVTLFASWMLGVPGWVLWVQAAVMAATATFILTRPDGPRRDA